MAKQGYGGMTRVDMEWSIEGANSTRTGKLYNLHEQEVVAAKQAIKRLARRGDTVNVREI